MHGKCIFIKHIASTLQNILVASMYQCTCSKSGLVYHDGENEERDTPRLRSTSQEIALRLRGGSGVCIYCGDQKKLSQYRNVASLMNEYIKELHRCHNTDPYITEPTANLTLTCRMMRAQTHRGDRRSIEWRERMNAR